MHAKRIDRKGPMNLKDVVEVYMGEFGGIKGKGECDLNL